MKHEYQRSLSSRQLRPAVPDSPKEKDSKEETTSQEDGNYTLQMIIEASLRPPSLNSRLKQHCNLLQSELKQNLEARKSRGAEAAQQRTDPSSAPSRPPSRPPPMPPASYPPQPSQFPVPSITEPDTPSDGQPSTPPRVPPIRPPRSLHRSKGELSQSLPHEGASSPRAHSVPLDQEVNLPANLDDPGVFCLSYYETKKLYDLGVVKQLPGEGNILTEEIMRKENEEYKFITQGMYAHTGDIVLKAAFIRDIGEAEEINGSKERQHSYFDRTVKVCCSVLYSKADTHTCIIGRSARARTSSSTCDH